MKTYKVSYCGNSSRFKGFETEVSATSERGAVESVFKKVNDANYFPQEDGSIKDCDGETIASEKDNVIDYDGGCFSAELII